MERIGFVAHGKEYEVRVISDGWTAYIRAFNKETGKPANGCKYQVDIGLTFFGNLESDIERIIGFDIVKHFIDLAKQDVIDKL